MKLSTGESDEHKAIVRALMNYLNQQGFQTVGAACGGFPPCEPIDGKVPDFVGKNSQGLWCIGEAKTCDDFNDRERTNEQFRAFSSRQATFYPCVPKSCIEQLNQILRELGLFGKSNIQTLHYG
jgi:hypothetical protein